MVDSTKNATAPATSSCFSGHGVTNSTKVLDQHASLKQLEQQEARPSSGSVFLAPSGRSGSRTPPRPGKRRAVWSGSAKNTTGVLNAHLALASNSRAQQEDEEEEAATKVAASSPSRIFSSSTTTGAEHQQSSSFSNRGSSSKNHGHAEKMFDFFRQLPDVDPSTAALDAGVHEHYKMHLVDHDLPAGDGGGAKISAKEFAFASPPAPPYPLQKYRGPRRHV